MKKYIIVVDIPSVVFFEILYLLCEVFTEKDTNLVSVFLSITGQNIWTTRNRGWGQAVHVPGSGGWSLLKQNNAENVSTVRYG